MIDIIPAERRHFTDMGWLQTYWLFSFGNYYDPENVNHGTLRVFNDDIVLPNKGFGIHPHEEMEIVSLVLEGEMQHQDTMGNKAVIKKNDVQRMTAGTGLQHSEWNYAEEPVHFFQIWVLPDKRGLAPSYDQKSIDPQRWKNRLALLAGEGAENGAVQLNTDAKFYRAELEAGKSITYQTDAERRLFVYVIDGSVDINGLTLKSRDQARISDVNVVDLAATDHADLVLIDIPANE